MKKYVKNAHCTARDPRGIFSTHTDDVCAASVVGPLGSLAFSLPTIEFALAKTEGSSTGVMFGDLGLERGTGTPTSPFLGSAPSPTQHEVLQNNFKILPNTKDCAASPETSAVSPGTTAAATGSGSEGPQTDAYAGSWVEDDW